MTFIELTCPIPGCGVTFSLPDGFVARRREDHRTFTCPNGHEQSFPQQTQADKYLESYHSARTRAERAEKELRLLKAKARKAAKEPAK